MFSVSAGAASCAGAASSTSSTAGASSTGAAALADSPETINSLPSKIKSDDKLFHSLSSATVASNSTPISNKVSPALIMYTSVSSLSSLSSLTSSLPSISRT